MATGSLGLVTLRGALGASEGAATTPTRLLYPGLPENVDLTGIQQFATIEDRRAWAKRDGLADVYNGIEDNTVVLNNVPWTFQDGPFYVCTLPGIVSGAGTGAGTPTTVDTSAYSRTFTPSQSVTAVGATGGYDLHLQAGHTDLISTVGWSIPGLRCSDYTLTFRKRASGTDTGVTWGGTWVTPKTATQITAFTGSLSDRAQTSAVGNNSKTYVDSTYANIGTTADANITEAVFHLAQVPSWHDGLDNTGLHTSLHFPAQWLSELTILRKFSDTTELAAWTARTLRAIRVINEGAIVGAVTAKNTVRLDFMGKAMEHSHEWVDGILYARIRYEGTYDATLLSSWSIFTQNAISTAYTAL